MISLRSAARIAAVVFGIVAGTCRGQPPEVLAANVIRNGFVANPVLLPATAAGSTLEYLNRMAPSSRRTFFVRVAPAVTMDAALNSGVSGLTAAGVKDAFVFDLDGERAVVFEKLFYEKRETLDVWIGNATFYQPGQVMKRAGRSGPAVLVGKNGQIRSGSAYMGGAGPFLIVGVGESLLAVREVDSSRFLEETTPRAIGGASRKPNMAAPKTAPAQELRIAVYYTRTAENQILALPGSGQNIRTLITTEISALRRSFIDAGIKVPVRILPVTDGAPTSYTEKQSIGDDVQCLAKREPDCKEMLEHRAHATILVRHGGCGMAAHGGGKWKDHSLAVAVVSWSCIANLQHGLIHELGHILGAQHENGAEKDALAFAKAYVTPDRKKGTLASAFHSNRERVPYWSTPKSNSYVDHPIGGATQDNALALSQTIPQIIESFGQQ